MDLCRIYEAGSMMDIAMVYRSSIRVSIVQAASA